MLWQSQHISATQLASDYVVGADGFIDKVVDLCTRLEHHGSSDALRQEACAALWAAMVTAIEASSFNEDDRTTLIPLVANAYLPLWKKHCGAAIHPNEHCARYLLRRDPESHLRTAISMVESLLAALNVPDSSKGVYAKLFSALFAHRILSDVQHFNEIKARYSLR